MPVALNHTIVHARDKEESARFYSEMFGLGEPKPFGPFLGIETANGVTLDFIDHGPGDIWSQHYAFIVTEDEFDQIFGRIKERGLDYFADPHGEYKGEINHHDGGRGVYWSDPSGHWLEIITRPYGSGG
jgi:extradiol dioxygenase family protein